MKPKFSLPSFTMARAGRSWLRMALPVIVVMAIAFSLILAPVAQALTITVTLPAGATLGSTYTFTVRVDVQNVDLLPLQAVEIRIINVDNPGTYTITLTDVPVPPDGSTTVNQTYTPASGGTVQVTGAPDSSWIYASGLRTGYGYGYQSGTWGTVTPGGTTYGYGYAYTGNQGPTYATYTINWTVPSGWPTGNYRVEALVFPTDGDYSTAFTNHTAATFVMSQPSAPAGGAVTPPAAEGTTDVSGVVTSDGTFNAEVKPASSDGNVTLTIPSGTKGTVSGAPLSRITIVKRAPTAPPSADTTAVSLTYDLGPDGAVFDPPVQMTFSFNPALLPPGADPNNVRVTFWNGSQWVVLEGGTVDLVNNTITVAVPHFTEFQVQLPTSPASFTLSGLTVSPATVAEGESVAVSLTVTNTGDVGGSRVVEFKVNGETYTRTIVLTASETRVVTVNVRGVVGENMVTVNGETATFTVEAAPTTPPTTPPATTPPETTPPETTPPATTPATTPPATTPSTLADSWLLFGAVAVAVIGFGLIIFMAFRRE